VTNPASTPIPDPFRLHIGGEKVKEGWKILNIQPGEGVDFLGTATDLSAIPSGCVDVVYGSHVYEHLDYSRELLIALNEVFRVLKPGGEIMVGVPDLEVLCQLFVHPQLNREQKFYVMRMIYGGQTNPWDYHKVGFSFELLGEFLHAAGFGEIRRVENFGIFDDTSAALFGSVPISLNVIATKPAATPQA